MKILFVSDAASIHTQRWAKYYHAQGCEVHVASFRAAFIPGIKVHVLRTYRLGRLGYFLNVITLRRLWRSICPDIVHAQYVTSYGFLSAFAGMRPLVLTAWGTDVLISPQKSRIMRWLASYAVRHADAVTTVAQHMNVAVSRLGIPLEKVSAVPFGVDAQHFLPPAQPRREAGVLRLICTRNFAPVYDVATLVTALQEVHSRGLDLHVDLVGDGPLRVDLEAQVGAAGLAHMVTFHGHIDHSKLAVLLAEADVFVTPALSDGNNVSLNEAMSCGCFPIATNIPANTQWIEDGVNGLIYNAGDTKMLAQCIVAAANNFSLRQSASLRNRRIVEERADWRICVARMDQIYARAIAHSKKTT